MKISNKFCLYVIAGSFLLLAACAGGPKPKSEAEPVVNETNTTATDNTAILELSALQLAQLKQAVANLNAGKIDIAKKSLLQLQSTAPENSLVLSNLAAIAFEESKPADAKKLAERAAQLNMQNAQAQNILGLVAVENGDIQQAEQAYVRALTSNGRYAQAHYNLALIYDIYYQDLRNAIKHYQAYLALTNFEDKQTLEWVQELESSLEDK